MSSVLFHRKRNLTINYWLFKHVSGSAYKIINARAYHHGTMLIDSRIDQLRDVLHNTKDTMVGRSVASVRSPVRNLSAVNPAVTHEQFCNAIVEAFVEQYSVNDKVVHIGEEDLKAQKYAAERAFVENSIIELEVSCNSHILNKLY